MAVMIRMREPDTRHGRDHHENYGEYEFANRDTL
jgi:hypothetical protein